jgi:ligand-binding sensor protein
MELKNIAPLEKWEGFEKEIHTRSGMNACVYNNEGNRITSYVAFANEVCPTIKAYPEGIAAICAMVNQYFGSELAKTKKPLIDECDAGFVKFAVPILYKGEFLGTVGGCGHLLADGEVETFLIEKAIGKDGLGLDNKINTVKKVSKNEIDELVIFVQDYLDNLLSKQIH